MMLLAMLASMRKLVVVEGAQVTVDCGVEFFWRSPCTEIVSDGRRAQSARQTNLNALNKVAR